MIDTSTLNTKHPLTIIKRITINTDTAFDNVSQCKLVALESDSNDDQEDIERIRKDYDLVALKTRNVELFQAACSTLNIDIISFHFDERLSFELDLLDIKRALDRRVYFEICYAPAIKDKQARLYTLQIAKQLFDYTKGRQWIISSGTESVSEVRNPFDIFYFAKSLGLANDSAKFTIEKNCEQVLLKAKKKQ